MALNRVTHATATVAMLGLAACSAMQTPNEQSIASTAPSAEQPANFLGKKRPQ